MVVPGDVPGVVHPVDLLLAEGGILMGEAPQLRPAHHVGIHAPPGTGLLAAVVHHAPAHQLHDAGAQDLRVDAQVPFSRVGQALAHDVGEAPPAPAGCRRRPAPAPRYSPRCGGPPRSRPRWASPPEGGLDSRIPSTSDTWRRVWDSPSLGTLGIRGFTSTSTSRHCSSTLRLRAVPHRERLIHPFSSGSEQGQRRRPGAPGQEPRGGLAQVGGGETDVAHGLQPPFHAVEVGVIGHMSASSGVSSRVPAGMKWP